MLLSNITFDMTCAIARVDGLVTFTLHTNGFLKITTNFIDVEESTKRIVLKFH